MNTGPLGQGLSHAVGMALAEAHLAPRFNRPGQPLVDQFPYVMASDGDLMEGVSAEACALAGHLGLGKLIVLYDDNGISLAGSPALSFTEDVSRRFEAAGWQVVTVEDGNDVEAVNQAITAAREEPGKPSLLRIRTCIGFGAPTKGGTAACHGSPLGTDELALTKAALNWPESPAFFVPEDVRNAFRKIASRGAVSETAWNDLLERYRDTAPDQAACFERLLRGELPEGWETSLPDFSGQEKDLSTRKASEAVLQAVAPVLPELLGGSADLNPSCLTWLKGQGDFQRPDPGHDRTPGEVGGGWNHGGRNIHFGVREHAMGAIAGGMALHGGLLPYTATFFTLRTTCARPCVWLPSWACRSSMCSPTTASPWVRTAPPIKRWNS
jgi:transketolase